MYAVHSSPTAVGLGTNSVNGRGLTAISYADDIMARTNHERTKHVQRTYFCYVTVKCIIKHVNITFFYISTPILDHTSLCRRKQCTIGKLFLMYCIGGLHRLSCSIGLQNHQHRDRKQYDVSMGPNIRRIRVRGITK